MSGIAGQITNATSKKADAKSIATHISHRGKNGTSDLKEDSFHLIQLHGKFSSTRSMATSGAPSNRTVLLLDGYISNQQKVEEMLNKSDDLAISGDAELMLQAIQKLGMKAACQLFEGIFAIAHFSERTQDLHLIRDRFGAKPLYYSQASHTVSFASEAKALVLSEGGTGDAIGVCSTLIGWAGTWGQQSLFGGILSVEPGTILKANPGSPTVCERYFELVNWVCTDYQAELESLDDPGIIDQVEKALNKGVEDSQQSQGTVGSLVSGGVDSNLITGIALLQQPDTPLYHAEVLSNSERWAAELVVKGFNKPLSVVEISDSDFLDLLPEVTYHNESPLVYHSNAVPYFMACKQAAADGVDVLLTGETADSFFLGSPYVVLEPYLKKYQSTVGSIQNLLHKLLPRGASLLWPKRSNDLAGHLRKLLFRYFGDITKHEATLAFANVKSKNSQRMSIATLANIHEHLSTLVTRSDRMGMALGIESRFPFLSHDLAKLAINLPARAKIRFTKRLYNIRHPFLVDKWALRQVATQYMDRKLSHRPKKGFHVPIYHRLKIDPSIFAGGYIESLFCLPRGAIDRIGSSATPLWMSHLMLTELWGRQFYRGESIDDCRTLIKKHVRII